MNGPLLITADDYGLTRHSTDGILSAVDRGALNNVSTLANGEALAYAIEEYAKRAPHLSITLHFNITEGKALSPAAQIPLLADDRGMFKRSNAGLLFLYALAPKKKRQALCAQVCLELRAQLEALERPLAAHGLIVEAIDGHQHVHMVPFIFDEIIASRRFKRTRIPEEPLYAYDIGSLFVVAKRFAGWAVLRALCARNRRKARQSSLFCNTNFIGVIYSGRMSLASVREGLSLVAPKSGEARQLTEIIFHPGGAASGELKVWKESRANIHWHYSPTRTRERELLMSQELRYLLEEFQTSGVQGGRFFQIARFIFSGGTAAVVNLVALYLFTSALGWWYLYSAVLAFAVSFGVSFTLQKFWTFNNRQTDTIHHQLLFTLALQVTNLCINIAALYVLVQYLGLWYMAAQVLVLAAIALWTFFVFKHRIFKNT